MKLIQILFFPTRNVLKNVFVFCESRLSPCSQLGGRAGGGEEEKKRCSRGKILKSHSMKVWMLVKGKRMLVKMPLMRNAAPLLMMFALKRFLQEAAEFKEPMQYFKSKILEYWVFLAKIQFQLGVMDYRHNQHHQP